MHDPGFSRTDCIGLILLTIFNLAVFVAFLIFVNRDSWMIISSWRSRGGRMVRKREIIRRIEGDEVKAQVRRWIDGGDLVVELVALLPAGTRRLSVRFSEPDITIPSEVVDAPPRLSLWASSADPVWAKGLLDNLESPDFLELLRCHRNTLTLDVRPGQFALRIRHPKDSACDLERFSREGYRLATLAASLSVEDVPGTLSMQAGRCPVCGMEAAHGDMITCPRCRTPHHVDCWKYNSGCGIFGC